MGGGSKAGEPGAEIIAGDRASMPKGVYAYDIRMVFVIWSSGENQTMAIERVGREALVVGPGVKPLVIGALPS